MSLCLSVPPIGGLELCGLELCGLEELRLVFKGTKLKPSMNEPPHYKADTHVEHGGGGGPGGLGRKKRTK